MHCSALLHQFGTLPLHQRPQLSNVSFQVIASNAAIKESGLAPENISSVCIGNVLSASAPDAPYLARHVALKCGLPIPTPALIGAKCSFLMSARVKNIMPSQPSVWVWLPEHRQWCSRDPSWRFTGILILLIFDLKVNILLSPQMSVRLS